MDVGLLGRLIRCLWGAGWLVLLGSAGGFLGGFRRWGCAFSHRAIGLLLTWLCFKVKDVCVRLSGIWRVHGGGDRKINKWALCKVMHLDACLSLWRLQHIYGSKVCCVK